jgi:hypothetical protein
MLAMTGRVRNMSIEMGHKKWEFSEQITPADGQVDN